MKRLLTILLICFSTTLFAQSSSKDLLTTVVESEGHYVSDNIDEATCEDFDALAVGDFVALQLGGNWTTWSGSPGSSEDGVVSDLYSISPSNSFLVEGISDLIHLITGDNITSDVWSYSLNIYIPDGTTGYFNLQKDVVPGTEWGFQVMFQDDMHMIVDGGGAAAAMPPYEYDTWYFCEIIIDLNVDWCEFYVDNVLILGYQWTLGTFGTPGALTLGGANYYANPGSVGTPAGAHFDDICFEQFIVQTWDPPTNIEAIVENDNDVHISWSAPENMDPIGFNIFRNDEYLDYVAIPDTEYYDLDLDVGTYLYCVSALYFDGESQQACDDFVIIFDNPIPGPYNLTGQDAIIIGEPIYLSWESPLNIGEWIHWDAGVNFGNGFGLSNGGTFSCASHWTPAELYPYNGLSLTKVNFYANGDPDATYTIKVWTGENGTTEVYSQDVTNFIVNEWNIYNLVSLVTISSAEDFWFGYEVTHEAGTFPAGFDNGPAVPYLGDMFLNGNGWISLMVEYGLDYNWNIQGWVNLTDSKTVETMEKAILPETRSVNSRSWKTADNKEFQFYNVYRKDPDSTSYMVIGTSTEEGYTDESITEITGAYRYFVTSVWDEGESDPSNIWIVDVLTSIEDKIFNHTAVYPNPAKSKLKVESEKFKVGESRMIMIYNSQGMKIDEITIPDHVESMEVDVSKYKNGLYYLLYIHSNQIVETVKLIKN